MAGNKGLLLVTMQPQAVAEDEFNDWYDTEHLPERAALPGVETALRYVAVRGWPRYLALYDLSALSVLASEPYLAVAGERSSPWTKRVTARVGGALRYEATQLYPGDRPTGAAGPPGHLALYRFRNVRDDEALLAGLRTRFEAEPAVAALRLFRIEDGAGSNRAAVIELRAPLDVDIVAQAELGAGVVVDLANLYAPYWRREHPPSLAGRT